MSYFGVSLRNGVGLGLGTVPSLTNTPLSYRLAPSLDLSFAGSDTLSPLITFSRTTNATLTNSAGLVANAPMNLLTYSEQFDNAAWIVNGTPVITANQVTAPDGTMTADTMAVSGSSNGFGVYRNVVSSGTYASSLYFKLMSGAFTLRIGLSGNFSEINCSTLVITNTGTGVGSVSAVGNGWYRFVSVGTISALSASQIYNVGSNTGTLAIWGAQLELGSTATTYNPTTVKNLLGYTEHFDNASWTKSNAFVQTNLLTYSQDFDNGAWSKGNASVAANSIAAPDNSLTADTVTGDGINTQHYVLQAMATTGIRTISVYAKAGTHSLFQILTAGSANPVANFDLVNGTANMVGSGATASITPAGNGWYRCVMSSPDAAATNVYFALVTSLASGRFEANTISGSVYFWGAQLVQGTSAGDYKATYAAAAAVGYTDIYGQPFAQKLVETTAAGVSHLVQQSVTTGAIPYVVTVYAKQAERKKMYIREGNFTGAYAAFDLSTGTVLESASGGTGSIVSLGNGWYRCAVALTATAASSRFDIGVLPDAWVAGDARTYTGDGTSGIYIFGAQLSDSASVDPYVYNPVAAPSAAAYYGPRFDYDPVTLAPKGLLIEEQRTNLVTYSEQFDNAAWNDFRSSSLQSNAAVAPDGTLTADKLVEAAATAAHFVQRVTTITIVNSTTYTATLYAKAAGRNYLQFSADAASGFLGAITTIDLSTGTVVLAGTGVTASATSVGNGWYRCSFTVTSTGTSSRPGIGISSDATVSSGSFKSYAGDGFSGIYIWGAQLEAGAFATSYIPTVASQVTRAADSASMIGNNFARWYNQTEGTFAAKGNKAAIGAVTNILGVSDGTTNNRMRLYQESNNTVTFNTSVLNSTTTSNGSTAYSAAAAYSSNGVAVTCNAGTVAVSAAGAVPVGISSMDIGRNSPASTVTLNGTLSRIAYYNRRLSNTELQSITA